MKRAVKKMWSKRTGSAIVLAMFAVLILFITGTGLFRLGLNSRVYAVRTAEGIKARCAADAGLAKALFRMNEKLQVNPWNIRVVCTVSRATPELPVERIV